MIVQVVSKLLITQSEPSDLSTWDWTDATENKEMRTARWEISTGVGLRFPHEFGGRSCRIEAYADSDVKVYEGSVVRLQITIEERTTTVFTGRVTSFNFRVHGSVLYSMECLGLDARAGNAPADVSANFLRNMLHTTWALSGRGYSRSIFRNVDDLFPTDYPLPERGFLGFYRTEIAGAAFFTENSVGSLLRQLSKELIQPSLVYEDGQGRLVIKDPIDLASRPDDGDVKNVPPLVKSKLTRVNRISGQSYAIEYLTGTFYRSRTIATQYNFDLSEGWNEVPVTDIDDPNFGIQFGTTGNKAYYAVLNRFSNPGKNIVGGVLPNRYSEFTFYIHSDQDYTAADWDPNFRLFQRGASTKKESVPAYDGLTTDASIIVPEAYVLGEEHDTHLAIISNWGWNTYTASTYGDGVDRVEVETLANDDDGLLTPDSLDIGDVITVSDYDDGNTRLRVKKIRWTKRNDGVVIVNIVADADCLAP